MTPKFIIILNIILLLFDLVSVCWNISSYLLLFSQYCFWYHTPFWVHYPSSQIHLLEVSFRKFLVINCLMSRISPCFSSTTIWTYFILSVPHLISLRHLCLFQILIPPGIPTVFLGSAQRLTHLLHVLLALSLLFSTLQWQQDGQRPIKGNVKNIQGCHIILSQPTPIHGPCTLLLQASIHLSYPQDSTTFLLHLLKVVLCVFLSEINSHLSESVASPGLNFEVRSSIQHYFIILSDIRLYVGFVCPWNICSHTSLPLSLELPKNRGHVWQALESSASDSDLDTS